MRGVMIARCIRNTGASLGTPTRGHLYSDETMFDLEIGARYVVLGLGIWETVLVALVRDETGKPNWLPVGLFEFETMGLPDGWEFSLRDGLGASGGETLNRWIAMWGYPELARNPAHSNDLIERDPAALEISFRELRRLDPETN
jgi:hypothetical protein